MMTLQLFNFEHKCHIKIRNVTNFDFTFLVKNLWNIQVSWLEIKWLFFIL